MFFCLLHPSLYHLLCLWLLFSLFPLLLYRLFINFFLIIFIFIFCSHLSPSLFSSVPSLLSLPSIPSFSSVHFCTYKDKFISLYCRLSSVLDLDALITQQALREAITDSEVATAKQRHQLILDYIQVTHKHTLINRGGTGSRSTSEDEVINLRRSAHLLICKLQEFVKDSFVCFLKSSPMHEMKTEAAVSRQHLEWVTWVPQISFCYCLIFDS